MSSTMSENWIEHRRGRDGELLGWMRPAGDGGAVGGPLPSFYTLPLPVPDSLRPLRR
jgi:hypothetical protein